MENYSKEDTDLFLNLYKEMEALGTNDPKKYNYLIDHHRKEYEMFRHMRNELSHSSVEKNYPFIVSKDVVELFKSMLKEVQTKAMNYAKKGNQIIFIKEDSSFETALKLMNKYHYSYLPIINEENVMSGILSSDAVIEIMTHRESLKLTSEDKVSKYMDFFSINNNEANFYLFVPRDINAYELEILVDTYQHSKSKLGIILITEHGRKDEMIIGLITPWDLVKMK